jgi:hypothetical protein
LKPVQALVDELEKLAELAEQHNLPLGQQFIVGHLRRWEKDRERQEGKPRKARLPGAKRDFGLGDGDWRIEGER